MKASITTFSLSCLLATSALFAGDEPRGLARPLGSQNQSARSPGAQAPGARAQAVAAPKGEKQDSRVIPSSAALPSPTPPDQIKPATIVLPTDAIEPWLLTKEVGPFLVLARTFRGPEAERYALALAKELRQEHGLPAHILRTKDFPNKSNIRGVPPLAPGYVQRAHLTEPEKVRSYDEAAVLVGNEKTLDASEALLHKVKKIKPKCLGEMPTIFSWRQGLSTAIRTTNPYTATQNIFPGRGKRDRLISQMNAGPRSVFHCPGRYTLPVAEYGGRSVFNPSSADMRKFENNWLRKSPLITAADDAEKVAERLAKDPDIQQTGYQPYVYHDRTSSKVMIGSFNNPNDPAAYKLREVLLKNAIKISERVKHGLIIAPGNSLLDLEDPMTPIKTR
ncbi:MAG: hypothetical protein NVSMB9_19130 [Isosphaeraceae bacterium]